jgi:nitrile hydratase
VNPAQYCRNLAQPLAPETKIRVWDSTAEIRYLVIPERPAGTDGWSEEQLADIVTRDAMIGTKLVEGPV